MNEQEIQGYIIQLRDAILEVVDKINELEKKVDDNQASADEKINDLTSTVYDEIINPANEYIAGQEKESRFEDFDEKFGEKLRPFNEDLSALEGEDYDVVRDAFDKYDDFEGDKMGEDEYVEALVDELGNKLDAIKKAFGVPEDTEIAVQETEGGDVEVVTEDGEVVASTDGDEELPKEDEEGDVEITEDEDEIVDDDGEVEDDPEEVAAFEEELKNLK